MDDVARLSAGVLKPRPALTDGSVKSLWLAEVRRSCAPFFTSRCEGCGGVEWSGVECNETEWHGVEWSGAEGGVLGAARKGKHRVDSVRLRTRP